MSELQPGEMLGSSAMSAAPADRSSEAVLTGGTAVPGHHSRYAVGGLDGIQGYPTKADRKRRWEPIAAADPADAVTQVVTGQVADDTEERYTKRYRVGT